jgi:hypothetical protein
MPVIPVQPRPSKPEQFRNRVPSGKAKRPIGGVITAVRVHGGLRRRFTRQKHAMAGPGMRN